MVWLGAVTQWHKTSYYGDDDVAVLGVQDVGWKDIAKRADVQGLAVVQVLRL